MKLFLITRNQIEKLMVKTIMNSRMYAELNNIISGLFFHRYKSLSRFSICLADSICADALDMLPYGNEIYIISSFECNEKHIDFSKKKYRANEVGISLKLIASILFTYYFQRFFKN